jgi:hypothetical protein
MLVLKGIITMEKKEIKRNISGLKFYKKGECPPHVKLLVERKLKKMERFHQGLEIECKKHGFHKRWRLHTGNNVQCLNCAIEWQMNQRRRNPLRFIFRDAKKHAIYHKRDFFITLKDLEELMILQEGKCALTGILFNKDIPPSLDRIDSKLGYTKDNIQLIQIKVNVMKSNLEQNDFIFLCEQIAAYSIKRRSTSKSERNDK